MFKFYCKQINLGLNRISFRKIRKLDWGSIRSSPRYCWSTPYRLTIRNSARLFHHVHFNMGDLHLVLPTLNLSTLDTGILIIVQQVTCNLLKWRKIVVSGLLTITNWWNKKDWWCSHWTRWTTPCPSSCYPPEIFFAGHVGGTILNLSYSLTCYVGPFLHA